MGETKIRFGIKFNKLGFPQMWSLGIALSHWGPETYVFINLLFVSVYIGKTHLED